MKKNILIVCAVFATFSLMAFSYINWDSTTNKDKISCNKTSVLNHSFEQPDLDLFYGIDTRFIAKVSKEKLGNSTSIIDILPKEETLNKENFQNVRVSILGENETTEIGQSDVLNAAQLEILQAADYSTNIRITSDCKTKNRFTGRLVSYDLVYYITIIPENQAKYKDGDDALIEYLKENMKDKTGIIRKDNLKPGQVSFTVTKSGTIENAQLESTSGYTLIDNALVELVSTMSENWNPATNSKGEKVDQQLIFFFGKQGC